jgi:hypothetical protein
MCLGGGDNDAATEGIKIYIDAPTLGGVPQRPMQPV